MTPERREHVFAGIRHGVTITVVAVLVWLFAEAQSVSERTLDLRVRISTPTGSSWVIQTIDPAWSGVTTVRVQGARVAVDDAVRLLTEGVDLMIGGPAAPAQRGRQVIDLREALLQNPPLDRAGVTIASVEPRTVEIEIDELVRIDDVPVRPLLPGVATVGEISAEPPTVTITAPSRAESRIGATLLETGVQARLPLSVLSSLPEGGPQEHEARIVLPDALSATPGASVDPATVTLTFTVRSTTERITQASVPIWPQTPPTEINRWDIEVTPVVLRDVSLVGPSDVIQRIRSGDLRVIATLRLSSDELEQRITSKAPEIIGLPDTVAVESPIEPVTLQITPRIKTSAPTGEGAPNGPEPPATRAPGDDAEPAPRQPSR